MIEMNQIIHADCMDIMKDIPDKHFDLCLTDYPYGCDVNYNGYEDTQENLIYLINKTESEIKRISKFVMITCGTHNIKHYKLYDDILCIQQPANPSFCDYGHITWQPILVYGKDPHTSLKNKWTSIKLTEIAEKNNHPCPKPLNFWKKVLMRGCNKKDSKVFDPFSGSGTTAIACIDMDFEYLCIEKDKEYFE